jgi:heme-degrading monooxygenase HmoA
MFAVIFEVDPDPERRAEYLELAAFLKPALEKIDGFLDVERFASRHHDGRVLSLSLWRDEKSVIRWRTLGAHHEVQAKGRAGIFQDYRLRVGEIAADTGLPSGTPLARHRFDETETGPAKAVTLTELRPPNDPAEEPTPPGAGTLGLVDSDVFESIYNPGKLLLLASWCDAAAAEAWDPGRAPGTETRHRLVRVIRDYGMFDRREAPQYYPAAKGTAPRG